MQTLSILDVLFAHVTTSTVVQLFLLSSVFLAVGLVILVWLYAVRLSHVQEMPLNIVEHTHPQLPTVDVILLIFFCHACVLLAVLISLFGADPFSGPYQWIALFSALLLSAGLSVYAELKARAARPYAAGVALGTSVSLFLIVLRLLLQGQPLPSTMFAVFLLLLSVAGSFKLMNLRLVSRTLLTAVLTAGVWTALFSLPTL